MTHTVPLEIARKLHEAGIEFKDCEFLYFESGKVYHVSDTSQATRTINRAIAAPILTELLEVLPKTIQLDGVWHFFTLESVEDYYVSYDNAVGEPYNGLGFNHKNPCEAAAELLLKLKREGLI